MRLIDADALKIHVCDMCDDGQRECKGDESCAILCWINDMPAVNRWIPVEDALPDALQNVLVCTDINTVTVAWLNGDHWTFADTGNGHTENWSFDAVKYWMNLPEPPKGEQK